jgi:hypothetical protein
VAAVSGKAFEVYHLGDSQADIREGQDFPKLWAKWHYAFRFVPAAPSIYLVRSVPS